MAYEVFMKLKNKDITLEEFYEFFAKRRNYRVEGVHVIYENSDTGVGFYLEYLHEEQKGAPNVCYGKTYRMVLCVEYCQPVFFFIEALYEIYDLFENEGFEIYDPQIGGRKGAKFTDRKLYESWRECNNEAVREYMISLGSDMDNVLVLPYHTLRQVWEWNYGIERLRGELDNKVQIPIAQSVTFGGEDLIAVMWKDGGSIAIPYVDVIIFVRGDNEFCAVNYEEVKPLIDKYSERDFANSFILEYDEVPEEIKNFINGLDSKAEFTLVDMCDVLEYEVVEEALGLEHEGEGIEEEEKD